mgnify:CR=1 FL=1
MNMAWHLVGLDVDDFIQHYWQKKPCLVNQTFTNICTPISPEELAGLACEPEVHSRLVQETGGKKPWQQRYGPFKEKDFLSLPESHYCLQVSECEKWIPEFADLRDQFDFLPNWRIDNVVIHYASEHGSIGPHIDESDLILIQLQGQQRWQYSDAVENSPALLSGTDLAVLQDFHADQEIMLNPGDMLYLPAGIAHHGVAISPGLTCIIEFRAPTAVELLESFVLEVDQSSLGIQRYSDPDLERNRHPAEITDFEINRFKSMVLALLEQPPELWQNAVGKLLSDSVISDKPVASLARINDFCDQDWVFTADSKLLYYRGLITLKLYCNGTVYEAPHSKLALTTVQQMCGQRFLPAATMHECWSFEPLKQMITQLVLDGALQAEDKA